MQVEYSGALQLLINYLIRQHAKRGEVKLMTNTGTYMQVTR